MNYYKKLLRMLDEKYWEALEKHCGNDFSGVWYDCEKDRLFTLNFLEVCEGIAEDNLGQYEAVYSIKDEDHDSHRMLQSHCEKHLSNKDRFIYLGDL